MTWTKLTTDGWRGIVAKHFRRAYASQWVAAQTDTEMDYAGERLIAEGWTLPQADWAAREVCRLYRRLDQPLAMMSQVEAGRTDRDGNQVGGWVKSDEYGKLAGTLAADRERDKCRKLVRELNDRRRCGRLAICRDCDLAPDTPGAERRYERGSGGFTTLDAAMTEVTATAGVSRRGGE